MTQKAKLVFPALFDCLGAVRHSIAIFVQKNANYSTVIGWPLTEALSHSPGGVPDGWGSLDQFGKMTQTLRSV